MNRYICCVLQFFLCFALAGYAPAQTRTVALSGQAPPGLTGPATFTSFSEPVLNDQGRVAFVAATSTTSGIWSEGAGSLANVARNDLPAPGDVNFTDFHRLVLNNAGQLAIEAEFSGGSSPNSTGYGFWTAGITGPLSLVARQGGLAPGHPSGAVIDHILNSVNGFESPPVLNDAGQFAFRALLRGPGINGTINNDKGLWWNVGAGLTPMIFSRDTSTGVANGVDYIGMGPPLINNQGKVLFIGALAPSGQGFGHRLADPNGTVTSIVSINEGFSNLIAPAKLNDAGDVAFWAIEGASNTMGVWRQMNVGGRVRVTHVGAQAPGALPGVLFDHLGTPTINAQGRIAFGGFLDGLGVTALNDYGIWAEKDAGLTLIARERDSAPGAANLVFKAFDGGLTHNGLGQIAFSALAGPASNSTAIRGIWATDVTGQLQMLAYPGMQIDVDNGLAQDLRTISAVSMVNADVPGISPDFEGTGNQDGLASAFNEYGQLAFSAVFTDGSRGVFVTNAVAVPEPVMSFMSVLAASWLVSHRPRRALFAAASSWQKATNA